MSIFKKLQNLEFEGTLNVLYNFYVLYCIIQISQFFFQKAPNSVLTFSLTYILALYLCISV